MSTCCNEETCVSTTETPNVAKEATYTKPKYRATQDEKGYGLRVYVPGVGKSGVSLSLANEVLTITGKRSDAVPDSWKLLSRELSEADYQLRLQLDAKIDPDRITAKVEHGVLDISLPLKETAQPRVIDVE